MNSPISFPLSEPNSYSGPTPPPLQPPKGSSFSKNLYRHAFKTNSWKTLLTEDPKDLPDDFFKLACYAANAPPAETDDPIEPEAAEEVQASPVPLPSPSSPSIPVITPVQQQLSSSSFSIRSLFQIPNSPVSGLEQGFVPRLNSMKVETPIMKESHTMSPPSAVEPLPLKTEKMEKFPKDKVTDFKHLIYNQLVDGYNSADPVSCIVHPVTVEVEGKLRAGFQFNESLDPDKLIPELYGEHIHQCRLDLENQQSPFIQDLYKFYLRAGLELLGKYFEKYGKYTFLYDEDTPMFVPGGSLHEAEQRIKTMRTRARKRERQNAGNTPVKRKATSRKVPYYIKCGLKL